ncbi:MAG: NFACT family protein, partial [Bacillota bacterium]
MAFDTLIMKAVTGELRSEFTGSPVQKIYENVQGDIILHLYSHGRQPGLLISVSPQYARIHMTYSRFSHKNQPSPFCMLLRKYLIGGRAETFSNPSLERILEIAFDPPYGMPAVKLIAEIMDRRSNLILVDEKETILGAAKTVSWDKNPKRAILPGEIYRPVPPQNKLNPLEMNRDRFSAFFRYYLQEGTPPEKALLSTVKGLSPLTAREVLYRSGWEHHNPPDSADEKLFKAVKNLFTEAEAGRFEPVLLPERKLYAAVALNHLPADEQVNYESISEMLDHFYGQLIREEQEKQLKGQLKNIIKKRLKKLANKKKQQEKELEASKKAPRHRLYGELLLAYSHEVFRGADRVVLSNFYDPEGNNVEIPLNPAQTASENAQHHFSRYQKAKKGRQKIRKQLNKTKAEIEYCQNLLYSLENSDYSSLEEVKQEMIEAGYLREKAKDKG